VGSETVMNFTHGCGNSQLKSMYITYYLAAAAPPRLKNANNDRETTIDLPIILY
jgi:hypothetical protein